MTILDKLIGLTGSDGAADNGDGTFRLDFGHITRRASQEELQLAADALQAEAAKRVESTTARDDAKRALSALDTIIAGAPTATTAQLRAAVEQLARIQKHLILATLGR